jgi:hypothetical protein
VFIPGLGHIYKGRIGLGVVLFLVTVAGYAFFIVPGLIVHLLTIADAYNGNSKDELRTLANASRARVERELTSEQRAAQAAASRRQTGVLVMILAGLLVLGFVAARIAEWSDSRRTTTTTRNVSAAVETPRLTEDESWRQRLTTMTRDAGFACGAVVTMFHQGRRGNRNYWAIRCRTGETYSLRFHVGDSTTPPTVRPCATLKETTGFECFEKL